MTGAQRGGVRGWPRTGRGWLAEISNAAVSVFFPSGCRICERVLTSASRVAICEECLSSFERVVCEVCGLPLPDRERERERGYNQAALLSKPLGEKAPIAVQGGAADAHAGAAGQVSAEFGGKMGVGAWRFCHNVQAARLTMYASYPLLGP